MEKTPIVVNISDNPTNYFRIDRKTEYGNPYIIGRDGDRNDVCNKYEKYALNKIKEYPYWLIPLKGKNLGCWCAPEKCHGDILLRLANNTTSYQLLYNDETFYDDIHYESLLFAYLAARNKNEKLKILLDCPSNKIIYDTIIDKGILSSCFTGHRPNKLNGYNPRDNKKLLWDLKDCIDRCIEEGVEIFITGMALGIDQWAARIILKIKENNNNIKLVAAIPCLNQFNKWPEKSKKEWRYIIDRCDEIKYVSYSEYTNECMQKRNEWMVDNSDIVIAVWDGSSGGTGNCVNYAKSKKKKILNVL